MPAGHPSNLTPYARDLGRATVRRNRLIKEILTGAPVRPSDRDLILGAVARMPLLEPPTSSTTHDGEVDQVVDIGVLSMPGSVDIKDPDHPVPARVRFPGGAHLSLDAIENVLDTHGIPESGTGRALGHQQDDHTGGGGDDTFVWRLHRGLGLHIVPMKVDGKGDKKPAVRWRRGATDYVEIQPSDADIRFWEVSAKAWAILCGGPRRIVCLDVEALGMAQAVIAAAVRDGFPESCQRPSPSGGRHAWVEITDGDLPATQVLARAPGNALKAEIRGQGAYGVVLGMGRGIDLPEGWAPVKMTRAQFDAAVRPIRDANECPEPPPRQPKRGVRHAGSPADTGEALFQAVVERPEAILELLYFGWEAVGYDYAGRLHLLRPDYADPTDARSSANLLDGVLICWSTSVPWATPGEPMTPASVLAEAQFGGDYAVAMRAVEEASHAPAE